MGYRSGRRREPGAGVQLLGITGFGSIIEIDEQATAATLHLLDPETSGSLPFTAIHFATLNRRGRTSDPQLLGITTRNRKTHGIEAF